MFPISRDNPGLLFIPGHKKLLVCGGFSSDQPLIDVHEIVLGSTGKWQRRIP